MARAKSNKPSKPPADNSAEMVSPPATDPSSPKTYTVLARRYRPQSFAEVVGQEALAQSLSNAILSNRVAHAYLFTGARGVGKTSTARILAKCLNCEKGPTVTPCGVCDMCQGIASGDDVDVLEIDAASNRGIDEIRNLRSNVNYRPSRSRFKIYVIDEVHMLTREAFNALLKTLEEPPPHVKFFFATTDPQRIPITILSRCQRFDLNGISTALIRKRLTEIVKSEGMEADEEALDLVARRANSSMRDAQSLLDQLLSFGSERLTVDQVYRLLGTASEEHIVELAQHVLSSNPAGALNALEKAIRGGFQMGELVDQLIAYWRDLMVLHCGSPGNLELSMPERFRNVLGEQAQKQNLDTILAGLDVLATTRSRLRESNHGRTLVEMALVRLGRLGELLSVTQLAQMLSGVSSPPARPARIGQQSIPGSQESTSGTGGTSPPRLLAPPEGIKKNSLMAGEAIHPQPAREPLQLTPQTLPVIWSQVLGQIGSVLMAHLEKAGPPAIFGPNALALSFPIEYNTSRDYCEGQGNVNRIEEALSKLLGRPISIRFETASPAGVSPGKIVEALPSSARSVMPKSPVQGLGSSSGPLDTAGVASQPPVEGSSRLSTWNPREAAEKELLVRRSIDVLGASLIRVDPDFGNKPNSSDAAAGAEEKR